MAFNSDMAFAPIFALYQIFLFKAAYCCERALPLMAQHCHMAVKPAP
jgi:hypothetical protein